jgi:hypothetical protein
MMKKREWIGERELLRFIYTMGRQVKVDSCVVEVDESSYEAHYVIDLTK